MYRSPTGVIEDTFENIQKTRHWPTSSSMTLPSACHDVGPVGLMERCRRGLSFTGRCFVHSSISIHQPNLTGGGEGIRATISITAYQRHEV
ncbi:hypothetical protein TNCV_2167311 [Trichonephila clavipes]|nr:hypothetical protein TNCV_2167311 [Trichonephila clavipes]